MRTDLALAAVLASLLAASEAYADFTADVTAARKILSQRCGQCHDHNATKPVRAALAVFDVAEDQWWTRMTDRQVPKLLGRMGSAPAAEKAQVAAFIAAEKERRAKRVE